MMIFRCKSQEIWECSIQNKVLSLLLGTLFFLFTQNLIAQTYRTTGGEFTDWDDPRSWTCESGPCNNNPTPNNNLGNAKVIITNNITYTGNSPIKIGNNGQIDISNGADLILSSNLNINNGGALIINKGSIDIGPGVLNNNGSVTLTNALVSKDGNFVNDGPVVLDNSCIRILDGNFNNNSSLTGIGSVKTLSGNINNFDTWDPTVVYWYSNNGNGLPESPDEEAVDALCECVLINCDILPGYPPNTKVDSLIGSALTSLNENYDATEGNPNEFIYVINGNDEVLIEIVVKDGDFNTVVTLLGNFSKTTADFIDDVYDPVDDQRVVTLFFPIADLKELNKRDDIINQVYEVSRGITNTGLINSQGDLSQGSDIARLGWNLKGKGIKVGVISDSYASDEGARVTDINNGDLPGDENPVVVVADLDDLLPGALGSDEGRAMLQIVHDVAPKAQLFFRTGFVSEGSMAAGIKELTDLQCDIIVDDVQYLREPFYKDGVIAQAIDDAKSKEVDYFVSAGNFGNRSFEATFNPSSNNPKRHTFGNDDLQSVNLGVGQYIIVLQWEDDFYSLNPTINGGAKNDLDIYLAGNDGSILYGFNRNNVGNDPVEIMPFNVINPTSTNIVVERTVSDGEELNFKYVVFRAGGSLYFDAEGIPQDGDNSTIVGHANAEGAITVGAVRYDNFEPQISSSRGGTKTETAVRAKPDIMAPTGVNTSVNLGAQDYDSDGVPNFFGTSAAAPHAAGVAALILEAQTSYNVAVPVDNLLRVTAIDMEESGYDVKSGFGFISPYDALYSFSNPTPNLIRLNLDNLDTELYEPGAVEFTLIIEGEHFDQSTVVFFRGEELPTTIESAIPEDPDTAYVVIPAFIGNPPIWVYTEPNPLTNGSDGGNSDTLTFDDPIILDVVVKPDDISRKYGEANPTFTFSTNIDGSGIGLTPAELELLNLSIENLETDATPTNSTGIYSINIKLSDTPINVGLQELYNFNFAPGKLFVDPLEVTIKPAPIGPLVYGQDIPAIDFEYKFGNSNIDLIVESHIEEAHTNALALVNRFALVNNLALVNFTEADGQPIINGFPLVNTTFYVSDNVLDASNPLEIDAQLFDPTNLGDSPYATVANNLALVNGFALVNNGIVTNGYPLVNGFALVNGLALVNDLALVNGLALVNSLALVNGGAEVNSLALVNSDAQPILDAFNSIYVLINANSDAETNNPIDIKPVNVITGLDVGKQYIIPGGYLDDNLIISYEATSFIIEPATLTVTTNSPTITYGENPHFISSGTGYQYDETFDNVFPYGINYQSDCPVVNGVMECDASDTPYAISISADGASSNYDINFESTALTVNRFDVIVTPNSDVIMYGDDAPLGFIATFSPGESSFPYGETIVDLFGTLTFAPSDGCTNAASITVNPKIFPSNYHVNYEDGLLIVENASMEITVSSTAITDGESIPSIFDISVLGTVCGDIEPISSDFTFLVKDGNGNVVTGVLDPGEYDIEGSLTIVDPWNQYDISTVPGKLYVNPTLGCNDRIKASDICKADATLADDPLINTVVQFEYTNLLDIPIFIPNGPNNKLKGKTHFVGLPPELFIPGAHTFNIYTDGGSLQWEVKTPGCNSASKSANGSNADPCDSASGISFISALKAPETLSENQSLEVFPNPARDMVTLRIGQTLAESFQLEIYNSIGQRMVSRKFNTSSYQDLAVDISTFAPGLLIFKIENGGELKIVKIIKE